MILEVAALNIRSGMSADFEEAFMKAQSIIASMPGYRRHEVRRCLEAKDKYLLLVWWDDLESHTVGFRKSAEYQEWKQLLHHFYDPFPVVEHFEVVEGLQKGDAVREKSLKQLHAAGYQPAESLQPTARGSATLRHACLGSCAIAAKPVKK